MLTCPICRKQYNYERKICQECEFHLISSGLTLTKFQDKSNAYNVLLDENNKLFKHCRSRYNVQNKAIITNWDDIPQNYTHLFIEHRRMNAFLLYE